MFKRTIDIMFSALGLVLAAPLILTIAILIPLGSPGPIFFSQRRLGRKGKVFLLHKFRKFSNDWGSVGAAVTAAGDARMTHIGRILERTKLDELPQLWNILVGEMSLVGPRPEVLRYKDLFQGEFSGVLEFVPGMFGPNQVEFRNESQLYPPDQDVEKFYRTVLFPKKAKRDLEYFASNKANIISDLRWIVSGLWTSVVNVIDWRTLLTRHYKVLILDSLAIGLGWFGATLLRYGTTFDAEGLSVLITGLWLFPSLIIPGLALCGVYRRPVRYFSGDDAYRLVICNSFLWMLSFLVFLGFFHRNSSILLAPMSLLLTLALMGGHRIRTRTQWMKFISASNQGNGVKVIIYGAGLRSGNIASLLERGFPNTEMIGIIDDRESMRGRFISKYPIIGCERDLTILYKIHRFTQIWMAFLPDSEHKMRLEQWSTDHNVDLIILPATEPFSKLIPTPTQPTEVAT